MESATPEPPETLESLLAWASDHGLYIELFGDGSVDIHWGDDYEQGCYGTTLREGLVRARVDMAQEKS